MNKKLEFTKVISISREYVESWLVVLRFLEGLKSNADFADFSCEPEQSPTVKSATGSGVGSRKRRFSKAVPSIKRPQACFKRTDHRISSSRLHSNTPATVFDPSIRSREETPVRKRRIDGHILKTAPSRAIFTASEIKSASCGFECPGHLGR